MSRPHFIIVGAQKAGTSNLRKLINQHPGIVCLNEINYFSEDDYFPEESATKTGLERYKSHFTGPETGVLWGDKSPNIYSHPRGAKRIASLFPEAKLIWVLREPVSRSYSDYWFSVYRGREVLSFEKAVALEMAGKRKNRYRCYLQRSDYGDYIREFEKVFDSNQMMFILLDEMMESPKVVANEVFAFLGVDKMDVHQSPSIRNPTYLPKIRIANYLSNLLFAQTRLHVVHNWVRWLNRQRTPGYPTLSPSLERRIGGYFQSRNRELANRIKKNLDVWDKLQ